MSQAYRSEVNYTPECDIYGVGMTLAALCAGLDGPPPELIGEKNLQKRIEILKSVLTKVNNEVSDVFVKLVCQCADPGPGTRPTALALLAIALKGPQAKHVLRESQSLWETLTHPREGAGPRDVGRTVYRFTTDYLFDTAPVFTAPEACIIMALASLYKVSSSAPPQSNYLLNVGNHLVRGIDQDELAAKSTILHAIAAISKDNAFLRELSWKVTKWPLHKSLRKLTLEPDERHFRPAMVAAMNGDGEVARWLIDIE